MSDLKDAVQRYLEIWNITDPAARLERIKEIWAAEGSYIDPLTEASGQDGFNTVVGGAQSQFAGLTFEPGSTYEEHHNVARFTWHLVPAPGAEPIAIGFDVVVLDDEGNPATALRSLAAVRRSADRPGRSSRSPAPRP